MTELSADALSVIVPVHDVAEYLPAFLTSLGEQGAALPAKLIFIDDGSTDSSAALVEAWISQGRSGARLIRTPNHGVSAARNRGLDEAAGSWVLFLDPDDVLAPGYFAALLEFLQDHPDVDLAATNLLRLQEPDTRLRDSHPLRFRFAGGDRVAELAHDVFVMNAASVAFPLAAVRASGARFRTGLHASEDALFVSEYLLSLGRIPRAGFVARARYGYRKRQAGTSAVDRYRSDASTYTLRFHEGYAPLLERAASAGEVPSWLQSVLLYEMQWLLPVQMDPQRYAEDLSDAQRAETLAGIARCLRHVSDERLLTYDASALPLESRLLILALTDRPLWEWVGAYAGMPRGWRRVADLIVYSGGEPDAAAAAAASTISWHPDYFGQKVLTAHRLRGNSGVRSIAGRTVIWPLPGESVAQTQDRHRRLVAEGESQAIPAQEGEVYVHRLRPWARDSAAAAALRRERRRRRLLSKDAVIGMLLRPGASMLFEDDADATLTAVAAEAGSRARVHRVSAGSGSSTGDLRFGSLRHRIARARAALIVSAPGAPRPSARARLRGMRGVVVTRPVEGATLLAVRRLDPEVIVTTDRADIGRLSAIGFDADDILIADERTPTGVASALMRRMELARRAGGEGEQ